MDNLLFTASPVIVVATNQFVNVPIIIQYESIPMLEVVREAQAGFMTKIPIYHSDGTKLAVVKGSEIYLTKDGEKAGLKLRHPQSLTVCELGDTPLFEIQKTGPNALKMSAELFTYDGTFLKWSAESISGLLFNDPNQPLCLGGVVMKKCVIANCQVGIRIGKNGIGIGGSG